MAFVVVFAKKSIFFNFFISLFYTWSTPVDVAALKYSRQKININHSAFSCFFQVCLHLTSVEKIGSEERFEIYYQI